ncbi:uncharacterized protein LOC104884621 isoform X2 [Beta vulgaris subsp. vulgaris]|uniref:uncharacterized protein LOC104884621 isoform X2 n=1 Tax=Beta vulgaris subsp. vulgaris TaxID=3555 RepID=UPI002547AE6C|nr:uncharacterized protein LOC104884621 isoform X2 [Beta vulgaris subsp. vulgaris]
MEALHLFTGVVIIIIILKLTHTILWVPWKIQRHFRNQGIVGPTYHPIVGNTAEIRRMYVEAQSKPMKTGTDDPILNHNITHRVMPFYNKWSAQYGKTFLYWFGPKPMLALADPQMIKEVLMNTSGSFKKLKYNPLAKMLFGEGLVGLEGDQWAFHRRIANQAFNMERVKMGDLMKRQFNILDLSGHKFLEWKVDAQMNLKAQGLEHTIQSITAQQNDATTSTTSVKIATEQEKAKALVLLRHHLHDSLKTEYLLVDDPKELWDSLNERYGHHKSVLLPKAHFDWTNLRFQDFKTVSDYNSTLFRIVSLLKYCDHPITEQEMIDKTLSTFHATNIILAQQYRLRAFKKYSELISVLLVAEQNNDLLLKNHNLRPTGSSASHEINAIESSDPPEANAVHRGGRGNYNGRGRGRGNYRGRGRGRGRGQFFRETIILKISEGDNKEITSKTQKGKMHVTDVV